MNEAQRLVRKAARTPWRVIEEREFWTPEFCRAFCEWCGEQAYEDPNTALMRAQIAMQLAIRTGDRHSLAKAHCVMAASFRMVSVLNRSEEELKKALKLAGSCPCCLADVYRCMGGIRLFQLRLDDAMACAENAINHYRTLGNEDGVGRTLIWRGVVHCLQGKTDAALEDEKRALRLLSPSTTPPFYYASALTNIAAILAKGEERHFEHASGYLETFRSQLSGIKGFTAVRLRLSWTHGLILGRLGERKRALQMLRKARTRLLNTRQDAEVLAITADIGRLYCETDKFHNLADLIRDSLVTLGDACGTRSLLQNVLHAAERELAETREHVTRLRAAVAVSVPSLFDAGPTLETIAAP